MAPAQGERGRGGVNLRRSTCDNKGHRDLLKDLIGWRERRKKRGMEGRKGKQKEGRAKPLHHQMGHLVCSLGFIFQGPQCTPMSTPSHHPRVFPDWAGNRKMLFLLRINVFTFHVVLVQLSVINYKYEHEIKVGQSKDSMSLVTVIGLRMDTWPKEV